MTQPPLHRFVRTSLGSAILTIGLSALASAQAPPAPQWLRFTVETVKPDMVQEYEGYKKQLAAAYKKAGLPAYVVLRNYSGNRFEYTTVVFVMKFSDLDSPSPVVQALGDEAFTNLLAALNRCVTSTTWHFSLPWDDVSIDKPGSTGQYFIRTRVPIAPGRTRTTGRI